MMLPYVENTGMKTRQQTVRFGGVHYGRGAADGELAQSENLSARQFPALAQRLGRKLVGRWDGATAIYAKDKLCVAAGTSLYYDGAVVGTVREGEKQIVSVNSKLVVFPDKVYYDTAAEKFGSLEERVTLAGAVFTKSTLTADPGDGTTLAERFAVNQAVEISGCSIEGNDLTVVIRGAEGNTLTFYENTFTEGTSTTEVTVERKVPDLDFICENDNRLWGVGDGTIWASALGDPLTFYNYDGLSTDSYAVAVGSEGAFTGCCSYGSNVLFWKENALYKMLGSDPSEYRMYNYTVPGVQQGSAKSLRCINEVLYYKGPGGVYAYTGNAPSLISDNFGPQRYSGAVAGTDGQTYYISMTDGAAYSLYSYDTVNGIWLREDGTRAVDFTTLDGDTVLLNDRGEVLALGREDGDEGRIPWMAEFAPFGLNDPLKKGPQRVYLRVELDAGAWIRAEIREDTKPWKQVLMEHAAEKATVSAPILPARCDMWSLRLTGKGGCVVQQLVRDVAAGGMPW